MFERIAYRGALICVWTSSCVWNIAALKLELGNMASSSNSTSKRVKKQQTFREDYHRKWQFIIPSKGFGDRPSPYFIGLGSHKNPIAAILQLNC